MDGGRERQGNREGGRERATVRASERERDSERERRDLKFMLLLNGNFVTICIRVQQPCSCHQPTHAYVTHSIQHACLCIILHLFISSYHVCVCACVWLCLCACARMQAVYPPHSFLPPRSYSPTLAPPVSHTLCITLYCSPPVNPLHLPPHNTKPLCLSHVEPPGRFQEACSGDKSTT
jgi:hypothetical protein